MSRRRWFLPSMVALVLMAAAAIGWSVGSGRLGDSRTDIVERIDLYRRVLLTVRDEREQRPGLDARQAEVVARTLGGDVESVDSALRDRLVRLIDACGLGGGVVSTIGTEVAGTPAQREFRRSGSERALRDEPDFVMVRASVNANGSVESVVRFLHALDAAPWCKRVEQVRLDPDRGGRRIAISARLSTLFVPGIEPDPEVVPGPVATRPLERYGALVANSPFRLPDPPKPPPEVATPAPVVKPPPGPPPVDPASRWMLTGVIQGDPGTEAWCRHLPTGGTATLLPDLPVELQGGVVATLVAVEGDVAVLRFGSETRRVLVGSTLDRPLP